MGPVGPCSPGIHLGYSNVRGPGFTGMNSVACRMRRGASVRSTASVIGEADVCAKAGRDSADAAARMQREEVSFMPASVYAKQDGTLKSVSQEWARKGRGLMSGIGKTKPITPPAQVESPRPGEARCPWVFAVDQAFCRA